MAASAQTVPAEPIPDDRARIDRELTGLAHQLRVARGPRRIALMGRVDRLLDRRARA